MPLQVKTSFASVDALHTELRAKLEELGGNDLDLASVRQVVIAPSKIAVDKAKHDALVARAIELGIDLSDLHE